MPYDSLVNQITVPVINDHVNRWQASIIDLMHLCIDICKQLTISNIVYMINLN